MGIEIEFSIAGHGVKCREGKFDDLTGDKPVRVYCKADTPESTAALLLNFIKDTVLSSLRGDYILENTALTFHDIVPPLTSEWEPKAAVNMPRICDIIKNISLQLPDRIGEKRLKVELSRLNRYFQSSAR